MLYIKGDKIKDSSRIIVVKDGYQIINPTKEMILEDGWEEYNPEPYEPDPYIPKPTISGQLQDMLLEEYNSRVNISDEEALKRPLLIYSFDKYIGGKLEVGQIISLEEKLYRVRQTINPVLANHSPSINTAALYEEINVSHSGTIDDPIPYDNNMALESGKYYSQDGYIYLCNRSTINTIYNPLNDVIGIYVEKIS